MVRLYGCALLAGLIGASFGYQYGRHEQQVNIYALQADLRDVTDRLDKAPFYTDFWGSQAKMYRDGVVTEHGGTFNRDTSSGSAYIGCERYLGQYYMTIRNIEFGKGVAIDILTYCNGDEVHLRLSGNYMNSPVRINEFGAW